MPTIDLASFALGMALALPAYLLLDRFVIPLLERVGRHGRV
jgi:hypothetical protein